MAALELVKFRVFIEGVLVPEVSAVTVNQNNHEATSATITMPPPPGFQFEHLTRAKVHIYWSDRRIRAAVGDNPTQWPIFFEGEVVADQLGKTPASRDLVLPCVGLNSYWEQVLYYFFDFSASAFARWPHQDRMRVFLGNKETVGVGRVPGLDLPSRLSSLVQKEIGKTYPRIVKSVFDESLAVNHFFQFVNDKLRLTDRFVSLKDRNLRSLISSRLFTSLVEQNVSSADGRESIMQVLKRMLQIFRYTVVQNAQPRLIRVTEEERRKSAEQQRVTREQDDAIKEFGKSLDLIIKGLDDVSLTESSTDDQIKTNARAKVEKQLKSKIQSAQSPGAQAVIEEEVETKSDRLAAQMVIIRDKLKESGVKKSNVDDGFLDRGNLLSQFMMLPDTRFVSIPECNVIFPSGNTSYQITRNHLQEPTRYAMILRDIANVPVGQPIYWAPRNIPGTAVKSNDTGTNGIGRAKVPNREVTSSNQNGFSPPIAGPINLTSPFGLRQETEETLGGRKLKEGSPKKFRKHQGIDLGRGSSGVSIFKRDVLAMDDGTVELATSQRGYGNIIYLKHDNGLETRYAHLDQFNVSSGSKVRRGQVIGKVGSTGGRFKPHLHLEVLNGGVRVDPIDFVISAIVSSGIPDSQVNISHQRQPNNPAKLAAARAAAAAQAQEDGQENAAAIAQSVAPEAQREQDLEQVVDGDSEIKDWQFLTPEEKVKGIIPYFDYDFDPTIALLSFEQGANKDDYIQSLVEAEFLWKKYSARQVAPVNGPFNPFPIAGLPGLIVDKHRSAIVQVESVSHTVVAAGSANTAIVLSSPRYWDEGDPYHWEGGIPGDANAVFPSYFIEELIDTNSYDVDPSLNEDIPVAGPEGPGRPSPTPTFGVGRDRPVDKIYQTILGCRAIPYYYGTRTDRATGLEVAYNKAIGRDERSPSSTIVGHYYGLSKDSFEAAEAFASTFATRYGMTEEEMMIEFLGSSRARGGTEYTGKAFNEDIQSEVRRLNGLLNEDAYRG